MKETKILLAIILSLVLLGVVGCSAITDSDGDGTGTLALSIADGPVNDAQNVYVTLDKVEVHSQEEGWQVINDFEGEDYTNGELEVDLLQLRFDEELLGEENLPAGTYDQIRLYVAGKDQDGATKGQKGTDPTDRGKSYVVYEDETGKLVEENIFIPSGTQSGLKINHKFTIEDTEVKQLVLDNDVSEILNNAGKSGMILLQPTAINIVDKTISGDVVGKTVADPEGDGTFEAVTDQDVAVKALNTDGEVVASTVATTEEMETDDGTKEAGSFKLRGLEEGSYTIEASVTIDNTEYTATTTADVTAKDTTDVGTLELTEGTSGTLSMSIADAPVNDAQHVYVTLDKVEVHSQEEGWQVVNDFVDTDSGELKVDLLQLRFDEELLGQKQLPTGTYDQIRLYVAGKDQDGATKGQQGTDPTDRGKSYVVYEDETGKLVEENIFIPSGTQSGLKINHEFTVEENEIKDLVLDNDVSELLNNAGKSGKILLKPTAIKIIDKTVSGDVVGKVVADPDSDGTFTAVKDQDVTVKALNANNEVVASTVATTEEMETDNGTRKAGSFKLRGLEEGSYTIQASVTIDNTEYTATTTVEVTAEEITDVGTINLQKVNSTTN